LSKNKCFFVARSDFFADFSKSEKLPAVGSRKDLIAQPLRRMIAYLPETHHIRKNQAPALNPGFYRLQVFFQHLDSLLI